MARKRDRIRLIVLFLLPAGLVYGIFVLWPSLRAMAAGATYWDGFSAEQRWVGLANFARLVHDHTFWLAIRNNLVLLFFPPLFCLIISLFFASVIARGIRGARLFRIAFFFPNIMSAVLIALLWSFIYNPSFGLLNGLLRQVHLEALQRTWLGPDLLIKSVVAPMVYTGVGFYLILFIAGIQNIPQSLYDAAEVDGASGWQTFWRVTLPLLWPMLTVAVVFSIIGGLKAFDIVWIMTLGNPTDQTHTMATYMYQKAFMQGEMGYGTAVSVVLFLSVFAASLGSLRLMRRETIEY
ncbi:MAG: carbohydrate ABC transporter permease [Armatimonadota bacterium]